MRDIRPPASAPGLPPAAFRKAFPFYMTWDCDLRITAVGPSMAKACPDVVPGCSLPEGFALTRPAELSDAYFRSHEGTLYLMRHHQSSLNFRGQVVHLEPGGEAVFLGTPWFAEPAELERSGLTVSDFAVHDQTVDLLQVVQTQRMVNADLQKLAEKLTEQRAKLRIQEAEARKLALVAARTDNAVVMTDASGCIEWVNDGFVRLTGYSPEEVLGKKPGSLLQGPETDPETVEAIRSLLARGEGVRTEILNYTKGGDKYWLSMEIQPILGDDGRVLHFMAVESDITERVMNDQRRSVQYAVARVLAEEVTVPQAGARILQRICPLMNWSAGTLWLPGEESGALRLAECWHQPSQALEAFMEKFRSLEFPPGKGLPGRVMQACRSEWVSDIHCDPGFRRAADAQACGLRSALALPLMHGGKCQGVMEFYCPDTFEPDEAMLQILDTVSHQIGQFMARNQTEKDLLRAKEGAEAANRAKSEFLATMSHEIRTPMNGVLGFAQLMQQTLLTSQQADYISAIRTSAESLLLVINDVLDFSKIESGRMELEHQPFSLIECVEEALETVSAAAAEKRLDLVAYLHQDVPYSVTGDGAKLRQVLVNLLGNAIKFTPSGEVVLEISCASPGLAGVPLHFQVRDTGVGIAPEHLKNLFQPFQQGDNSTSRRFGGTGLGLAICRRLIELMQGSITANSKPGEGSVFSFEISLPSSPKPFVLSDPEPCPSISGRRVLVVEGHATTRQVLEELLSRWGMDVRSAASPSHALALMSGWTPQTLLMDAAWRSPADLQFVRRAVEDGASFFLLCRPGECLSLRSLFGELIAGTLFKPVKVSPLFHALLTLSNIARGSKTATVRMLAPLSAAGRPPQLLLAEDNAINRKLALAALAQLGCTADVAVDGREAVEAAANNSYDAILMDVQMPGMDGLEATRAIRRREKENQSGHTKIIALTANALSGDRAICLDAGMDDYLSKPIRLEALRQALQLAMATPGQEPAPRRDVLVASMEAPSAVALRQLANELSAEDAASLASDFLSDLDAQLDELQEALTLRNAEEARRLAHSLKGTSSIFCLDALREAAEAVESSARGGDASHSLSLMAPLRSAATAASAELRTAVTSLAAHSVLVPMS